MTEGDTKVVGLGGRVNQQVIRFACHACKSESLNGPQCPLHATTDVHSLDHRGRTIHSSSRAREGSNFSASFQPRSWIAAALVVFLVGTALSVYMAFDRIIARPRPSCNHSTCPLNRWWHPAVLRGNVERGIRSYLDLYPPKQTNGSSTTDTMHNRRLTLGDTSSSRSSTGVTGPTLVVAGKMSVDNGPCNIAQFDLRSRQWSLTERIQLSLYNSYSGGEVYSLLLNHTTETSDDDKVWKSSPKEQALGSGELIVIGAFDTTYRNSQVTYCSVGMWDGEHLSKVGEGLCNSALSKGMKITTAAMAGPQDVYVAGSFHTQVWNGDRHEFVKIFNIAHFNAVDQVWLPLNIGQITCSWCTVTVLALAWDSTRHQLHVAGKFNAIDGSNVPAGLAIYDLDSGHLVAHPGGGLSMKNRTQDGVGTALQLDEETGVLYVMGSFERLTATNTICQGMAAYEIETNRWTCLADKKHSVLPTGGGNMLLTPYGLMVAGETTDTTTWPDKSRPYTIALLTSTLKKNPETNNTSHADSDDDTVKHGPSGSDFVRAFNWTWLPGFDGHDEPLHGLSNGFDEFEGNVFICGDNFVAMWFYELKPETSGMGKGSSGRSTVSASSSAHPEYIPVTQDLSEGHVIGAAMAISQMMPEVVDGHSTESEVTSYTIIVYWVALGTVIGMVVAIMLNRRVTSAVVSMFSRDPHFKGIPLDTLTYSAVENPSIMEAYNRAMLTRHVQQPHLLTLIDPQEMFLQRIIGEGSFGRVWSAKWGRSSVAVKEFVFAQAAVAGRSSQQKEIIEEIIGEAGMMAILRHPNVLQLFGCCLTAQAIWIVSELCSLGSLRQLLDDNEKSLKTSLRMSLALQVAEGMNYLHNQDAPIIHRDLKSHNIFVHETFTEVPGRDGQAKDSSSEQGTRESTIIAKIGDWGSARATLSGSRTMTHGVGTACWLAPEVINHARASKFSDVYSYGIVLWELATREEVYQGLETTQIIAKVANEGLRPPVPMDCPWKEVMVRCWEESPMDRLEFGEIVEELDNILEGLPEDGNSQRRTPDSSLHSG